MDIETPTCTHGRLLRSLSSAHRAVEWACELAILPTRSNLEAVEGVLVVVEGCSLRGFQQRVKRKSVMDIWSRIFPEAVPFVRDIYDNPSQTFAAGDDDWNTPCHLSIAEGVHQGEPTGTFPIRQRVAADPRDGTARYTLF